MKRRMDTERVAQTRKAKKTQTVWKHDCWGEGGRDNHQGCPKLGTPPTRLHVELLRPGRDQTDGVEVEPEEAEDGQSVDDDPVEETLLNDLVEPVVSQLRAHYGHLLLVPSELPKSDHVQYWMYRITAKLEGDERIDMTTIRVTAPLVRRTHVSRIFQGFDGWQMAWNTAEEGRKQRSTW